ncbi:DUF2058 domain-containing protein [Pseudomonadota bacterium]
MFYLHLVVAGKAVIHANIELRYFSRHRLIDLILVVMEMKPQQTLVEYGRIRADFLYIWSRYPMGNSLFDQLKKSGLVDKGKAQKAKRDQYKNKQQKNKKGSSGQTDEAKLLAEKAHAEKVERDRKLNQERKEAAEKKAVAAQIKQLIETNRVENRDGELIYNFTDGSVVKRLYVSEQVRKQVAAGRLAIARLGEGYELVPLPVAEKIMQRDDQCIILCEQTSEPEPDEDDPYADYHIPDDLMW